MNDITDETFIWTNHVLIPLPAERQWPQGSMLQAPGAQLPMRIVWIPMGKNGNILDIIYTI